MTSSSARGSRAAFPVLFLLLLAAVDLVLDVRDRDAFTWMDPHQYLDAARGIASGSLDVATFALPSFFPWLVAPFVAASDTIPSALLVQVPALVVLVLATWRLHRSLALPGPAWAPVLLVLAAPVTLGLSRELYAELSVAALTAVAVLAFRSGGPRGAIGLGLATFAGVLLKVSFPIGLLGVMGVQLVGLARDGRTRDLIARAVALGVGGGAALVVFLLVLPGTREYLLTLGNTVIPDMRVVGPPAVWSVGSVVYYPFQLAVSFLGVALVLVPIGARRLLSRDGRLSGAGWTLLGWVLGPMLLLVLQPVKEPRYLYAALVPAALLAGAGWPRGRTTRAHLTRGVLVVAILAVFAHARTGRGDAPYYLRGPIAADALVAPIRDVDLTREPYRQTPAPGRKPHWAITQSILLQGFDANEALALTWALRAAVVIDLDALERRPVRVSDLAYDRFTDPFMVASFSTYNRRCRWPTAYETLPRDDLVDGATVILVKGDDAARDRWTARASTFVHTLEVGGSPVHVFRGRGSPGPTYRERYALAYRDRAGPALAAEDRRPLRKELATLAILRGDAAAAREVLARAPGALGPARNVYWLRSYEPIHQILVPAMLRRMTRR